MGSIPISRPSQLTIHGSVIQADLNCQDCVAKALTMTLVLAIVLASELNEDPFARQGQATYLGILLID